MGVTNTLRHLTIWERKTTNYIKTLYHKATWERLIIKTCSNNIDNYKKTAKI